MPKHRRSGLIITLVIIAVPLLAVWQRQAIFDMLRLYDYRPPSDVAQLATDTDMTPATRRLFYVYHPSVEEKAVFNSSCRRDEHTIVLGCYINGRGIYLLNVNDSRLTGVEQVTAAHETLHAAYARLSLRERKKVDAMTAAAFTSLNDKRLNETIELYREQDPSVIANELHSILGTEIRALPAELEEYYKQYFADRTKVVAYSEQYEQAFTERKNQIIAYDAELSALKQQITDMQDSLARQEAELSSERERLSSLRTSGQASAYNASVPGYNARVNKYNADIDRLSDLIDKYNTIVPLRNAIAAQEEDLVKAIDSRSSVPSRQ